MRKAHLLDEQQVTVVSRMMEQDLHYWAKVWVGGETRKELIETANQETFGERTRARIRF